MSIRLRELIRNVRACKTQADERACIHKECASIRTAFKEESNELRHRNVAKLLFIHMLGYPTHWGQMECLKLIAGSKFLEKRIGYLGLMILLDERQEVLMLVENSLKNDLQSQNQYICGLACCSIGNISSAEICRDLSPEVEKLMVGSNPFVAKKAALCSIRILRKCPELVDNFVERVGTLLGSRNHAVLLTALKLMREICETEPPMVEQLRRHTSTLIAALKNLVLSGYAPEHDVHGIVDPFLQVEILRVLRILGKGHSETSDQMNDILAQVATNTESAKNAGNAILYECVLTIMAIEVESGLRVLAINILGRFLINRDNNIRYVALNTLHKVVASDPQAVQRHRNTIVDCLKDADSSIRQRALELVYALVNEANVKILVKELLSYLIACDVEFKDELTQRICHVVEKYAKDHEWHVDTIIQTLSVSNTFTNEETVCSMIALITSNPPVQGYATHKLYSVLAAKSNQPVLLQLGVWCIGEYGELLVGSAPPEGTEGETPDQVAVVKLLEGVLRSPVATTVTRPSAAIRTMQCARDM
jgi:AP-1 complex subunit gamma-1